MRDKNDLFINSRFFHPDYKTAFLAAPERCRLHNPVVFAETVPAGVDEAIDGPHVFCRDGTHRVRAGWALVRGHYRCVDKEASMKEARAIAQAIQRAGGQTMSVEFSPFTVLVGPHGVGKTRVLRKIAHANGAQAALFRLDARRLAEPCPPDKGARIGYDGTGLATVLANLKRSDAGRFGVIEAALRKIAPNLRGLRIAQEGETGYQLLFDFKGAARIPAADVSEGTLIALGLMALLHTSAHLRVILLDNIDQAIHPRAQAVLVAVIRQVLKTRPELQIVATTHSSYLVDEMDATEVVVMGFAPDGTAVRRALSDHPDAAFGLKAYQTGEFWSAVGEAWVAG